MAALLRSHDPVQEVVLRIPKDSKQEPLPRGALEELGRGAHRGGDVEEENAPGSDDPGEFHEKLLASPTGEPEDVPIRHGRAEGSSSEREPLAGPANAAEGGRPGLPCRAAAERPEHREAQVDRDDPRVGREDRRSEPPGTGSEFEHPAGAPREMPGEKTPPEFPSENAPRGPGVPGPLPPGLPVERFAHPPTSDRAGRVPTGPMGDVRSVARQHAGNSGTEEISRLGRGPPRVYEWDIPRARSVFSIDARPSDSSISDARIASMFSGTTIDS